MSALTQWFTSGEKPVHVGVYESGTRQNRGLQVIFGGCFQYWNGKFFCLVSFSPQGAAKESHNFKSAYQNEPWRGLAAKP
jgi:hypothetical protein